MSVEIVYPDNITNSQSDYVSFKSGGVLSSNQACFQAIKSNFGKEDIWFYQNKSLTNGKLPLEMYATWIDLCKEHCLIPKTAKVDQTDKDGIFCFIPKGSGNFHQYYAASSCCRWADSMPRLCYATMELCRSGKIHFFQALHYAMAKYVTNTGHSISSICTTKWGYAHGFGYRTSHQC